MAADLAELERRRARYETHSASLRAALLADEHGNDALWSMMEFDGDVQVAEILDGASAVRRETLELMRVAEAQVAHHLEEAEKARARLEGYKVRQKAIEERVIRPLCERAGAGDTKVIDTGLVRVAIHRKPPSVLVDPDVVPLLEDRFRRVKIEADKKALKQALVAGEDIPGVELVDGGTRVDWK